jgi:hypothetical protein
MCCLFLTLPPGFQAEGECMVLKVFSVGPLAKLAAFTGLGRAFSFMRGATPIQVTVA